MLPQARMVAKLRTMAPVMAAASGKLFPLLVPQGPGVQYPALCYQVLENIPQNTAGGATKSFRMQIRVAVISPSTNGARGYEACWGLASAVIGDCNSYTPTGLSGWRDDEGSIWHLEDSFDEVGQVIAGEDVFDAFVVNLLLSVCYSV